MNHYQFTNSHLDQGPFVSMSAPPENTITFNVKDQELLRIDIDGFYVRGVRVETDDKEAAAVYRAFKQFLVEIALRKE